MGTPYYQFLYFSWQHLLSDMGSCGHANFAHRTIKGNITKHNAGKKRVQTKKITYFVDLVPSSSPQVSKMQRIILYPQDVQSFVFALSSFYRIFTGCQGVS